MLHSSSPIQPASSPPKDTASQDLAAESLTAPSFAPPKSFSSIQQLAEGLEFDLSKLEGASKLDSMPPDHLTVIEKTVSRQLFGQTPENSLVFTGAFGRFRLMNNHLAEVYRAERQEEWNSPESRALREEPRSALCPSLANCTVVSGIGNTHFADTIAAKLGLPLTTVSSVSFANSEIKPILSGSVRGRDVFLVQRFPSPVNEYIVGNQLVIDALRRADPRSVTLIAPSFPYVRQDRRGDERTSVSSAVIARQWEQSVDGVLTVDIHSPQIESLFQRGFHNFSGHALMLSKLHRYYGDRSIAVVFPDEGGAKRAEEDHLPQKIESVFGPDLILAHLTKRRAGPNQVAKVSLMLEDREQLKGRTALVFDDILDTGGTALKGAIELKRSGIAEVVLVMTHPVASRSAFERMQSAMVDIDGKPTRVIDRIFVTDSIPISSPRNGFVEVTSLSELYAHAILRLCQGHGASLRQLSDLFSGKQPAPALTSCTVGTEIGAGEKRLLH